MKYLVFTANVSTFIQYTSEGATILLKITTTVITQLEVDKYLDKYLYSKSKYSTCDIHGYLHEKYPRVTGILSAGFPRVQKGETEFPFPAGDRKQALSSALSLGWFNDLIKAS
ncbi:hypothetical protein BT96DRAFT_947054 [Gymnopus androsaceus JB14]|uniref:Uncharacterized protein n=1 Tax=Gymnopus androsaceus JB14 TaxID=1447944 RepID=A0A6A4GU05_9AGAR|nr:hypothetical protein BT96DRAFT_947054 [Gymnopus androsaceus JB14]